MTDATDDLLPPPKPAATKTFTISGVQDQVVDDFYAEQELCNGIFDTRGEYLSAVLKGGVRAVKAARQRREVAESI